MFSANIRYTVYNFRQFSYLKWINLEQSKLWHYDAAMHVVRHSGISISPTIALLCDVKRGSPDDEFQEFMKLIIRATARYVIWQRDRR